MCPVCKNKLIPVVYGHMDDKHLELHKLGKIVLAGYRDRYADKHKSYCLNCLEGSDIFVDIDY
jgi:hypothetical protein